MAGRKPRLRFFTLSTCPFCKRMERFLDECGITYELIEVDKLEGGEQWAALRELKKYNPDSTFPTVIVERVFNDIDSLKEALGTDEP